MKDLPFQRPCVILMKHKNQNRLGEKGRGLRDKEASSSNLLKSSCSWEKFKNWKPKLQKKLKNKTKYPRKQEERSYQS